METIGREGFDVIVVGAGNAATCAALSARENGGAGADAGDRPRGGARRQLGLHRRRVPRRLSRRRGPRAADPRHERDRAQGRRFRHLHRGAVFRRYGPPDPVPLRPRHDRDPDPPQLRDRRVDARQRGALSARARPAGVPGRRQVQILGRARLPHLGRRQGIDEGAARKGRARRDHGALRDPGDRPAARRPRRRGGAGAPPGPPPRPARQGGDPRLRRVRGQCRDAGALSRTELGPRQGARHAVQHRPGAQDGARYRRRGRRALVGRRMPSPGI